MLSFMASDSTHQKIAIISIDINLEAKKSI